MMGDGRENYPDDDFLDFMPEGDCPDCDGQGEVCCNCDGYGCSQCIDGMRTCEGCDGSGYRDDGYLWEDDE